MSPDEKQNKFYQEEYLVEYISTMEMLSEWISTQNS